MKPPGGKYRFTLQWSAETEEKIQAGELLESLGNRKSELLVTVLAEYIRFHPEILSSGSRPQIVVRPSFTREQLETMVRAIVEERIAGQAAIPIVDTPAAQHSETEAEIRAMLENLALFQ